MNGLNQKWNNMADPEDNKIPYPSLPIVTVTYNRPGSLRRLLDSLAASSFPHPLKLIISIDGGGDNATIGIARDFEWNHGEKEVIVHPKNLGLRNHILSCGDISQSHDGVIILEDDLFVAPFFYDYVSQAYKFYNGEKKVAGISLYAHHYNETAQFPFIPLDDGTDVFFIQYASSWGQMWTRQQWKDFREWYGINGQKKISQDGSLPENVIIWADSSWKKYFIKYLIDSNKYFVFPRTSLTTNFCDEGHHMKFKEHFLQEPLPIRTRQYRFIEFSNSASKYDSHCEILPEIVKSLNPKLKDYDFAVDLYRMKHIGRMDCEYLLTARPDVTAVMSFAKELKPHEANVIFNLPGKEITLSKRTNFTNRNFYVKMLESHRQSEMAYHYKLRRYHFYSKQLLFNQKKKGYTLGFLYKKVVSMISFIIKRFLR